MQGIMPSPLEVASQVGQLIGWVTIISGLIWFVRADDKRNAKLDAINSDTVASRDMAIKTLGVVSTTQDNHMVHLAQDMHEQKLKQDKTIEVIADQTKILVSIDKGIAILADRQVRS